jgi:prolipoprotein diacylglyceryltransferase
VRPTIRGWLAAHGLGALPVPDYFTLAALATLLGSVLALRLAARDGASRIHTARAIAWAYVAALVGGYVFEALREVPAALIAGSWRPVTHAGRAAYGGLLAGIGAAALYLRTRREPLGPFFDRVAPSTGLVFALVRTGCFLAGCDYGRPTSTALGVRFPAGSLAAADHLRRGWVAAGAPSLPVHPTQLYEAALGLVAGGLACLPLARGKRDGSAFATFLGVYAVGRFALELLRGDADRGGALGLSTAQWVSTALVLGLIAIRDRTAGVRLQASTVVILLAALAGCARRTPPVAQPGMAGLAGPPRPLPWPEANAIVARIKPPVFPERRCPVRDFGARGDGQTDDTEAFRAAIAACAAAGGGHVVVGPGRYVTGAVELLDDIDLHLEDATLAFSGDERRYPIVLTRFEGIELQNHSPLVRAFHRKNVAVTGRGTLDASGTAVWNRDSRGGRAVLHDWGERGTPVEERHLPPGESLRSTTVEPYGCENVLIQGITIKDSRFWQIHPTLCRNVTIDGVTTHSLSSQTDACDPESSTDVLIQNCSLMAGDDSIAIKSGRDHDGRRLARPSENIVIRHSILDTNWGMITVGSEESGGVRHVYVHDVQAGGDRAKFILYVKANTDRGGFVEDINLDGVTADHVQRSVVFVTLAYAKATGTFPPRFDKLSLSHVQVGRAPRLLNLVGLHDDRIGAIHLSHATFPSVAGPSEIQNVEAVRYDDVTVNGAPLK